MEEKFKFKEAFDEQTRIKNYTTGEKKELQSKLELIEKILKLFTLENNKEIIKKIQELNKEQDFFLRPLWIDCNPIVARNTGTYKETLGVLNNISKTLKEKINSSD